MYKVLDHVENARKSALGQALNDMHQSIVKFRLFGLHMIDELDKRLVTKFDQLADDIEAEIKRINQIGAPQEIVAIAPEIAEAVASGVPPVE